MSTSSILTDKWNMFKTGGCIPFIKMLIVFFLPKTEDISHLSELTHASVIGISETKLDVSISSNEIGIDGYDIIRIDSSRKGSGAACFIKHFVTYIYKINMRVNTDEEKYAHPPKLKSFMKGILYRSPDKNNFVNYVNQIFTE